MAGEADAHAVLLRTQDLQDNPHGRAPNPTPLLFAVDNQERYPRLGLVAWQMTDAHKARHATIRDDHREGCERRMRRRLGKERREVRGREMTPLGFGHTQRFDGRAIDARKGFEPNRQRSHG